MTLEVSFKSKIVSIPNSSKAVKLNVWDTAGEEKFRSVTRMYYRDAAAACVIFDVTNRDSFDHAADWMQELVQNIDTTQVQLVVVGNKIDLDDC